MDPTPPSKERHQISLSGKRLSNDLEKAESSQNNKIQKTEKGRPKTRKDFTLQQRIKMINEIDAGASQISIADKYGISRESLRLWRKNRKSIEEQISCKNKENIKRVMSSDPLSRIASGLLIFYELNQNMPKDFKIPITSEWHGLLYCLLSQIINNNKPTFLVFPKPMLYRKRQF
jgi:hypothetical protein